MLPSADYDAMMTHRGCGCWQSDVSVLGAARVDDLHRVICSSAVNAMYRVTWVHALSKGSWTLTGDVSLKHRPWNWTISEDCLHLSITRTNCTLTSILSLKVKVKGQISPKFKLNVRHIHTNVRRFLISSFLGFYWDRQTNGHYTDRRKAILVSLSIVGAQMEW